MGRALRALLPAAILGCLLAPMARAQQMYAYSDLSRSGDTVFGYVETDLWSPYWYCGWGCGGVYCWEEYTSFAQATLYLGDDYEWMGGYWWQQQNGWASAWVWHDVDVGIWRLQAEHEMRDLWYQDEYCFSYWVPYWSYERHPWPQETVDPVISISGTQYVDDGGAGYFRATAEVGFPIAYEWTFEAAPGGGNDPHVEFSDPQSEQTLTDAHWYAYPDQECAANGVATYWITAAVEFMSGPASEWTYFWVNGLWNPAGITNPPSLIVSAVLYFSEGLWRVHADTSVQRTAPLTLLYIPYNSQFRYKVERHEEVHRNQWGPQGMNGDLYNPLELRALLLGLAADSQSELISRIQGTVDGYMYDQAQLHQSREFEEEEEAYRESDYYPPHYLYQWSCWLH